jgi:hypothetical protein
LKIPKEVVGLIYKVSTEDRACKQTPTLYALAICARSNDPKTKHAAYKILGSVCRIPTIEEGQTTQLPKEKVQRTNNDLQSIHIKLKIEQHEPH